VYRKLALSQIHRNYNGGIENLDNAIRTELLRV